MADAITKSNGRTARGQFANGNGHGRGRLPVVTQRERLDALMSTVSDTEWKSICQVAVTDALHGDRHAREWLSRYLLPPSDAVAVLHAPKIEIETYSYMDAVRAIAPVGYEFPRDD